MRIETLWLEFNLFSRCAAEEHRSAGEGEGSLGKTSRVKGGHQIWINKACASQWRKELCMSAVQKTKCDVWKHGVFEINAVGVAREPVVLFFKSGQKEVNSWYCCCANTEWLRLEGELTWFCWWDCWTVWCSMLFLSPALSSSASLTVAHSSTSWCCGGRDALCTEGAHVLR